MTLKGRVWGDMEACRAPFWEPSAPKMTLMGRLWGGLGMSGGVLGTPGTLQGAKSERTWKVLKKNKLLSPTKSSI